MGWVPLHACSTVARPMCISWRTANYNGITEQRSVHEAGEAGGVPTPGSWKSVLTKTIPREPEEYVNAKIIWELRVPNRIKVFLLDLTSEIGLTPWLTSRTRTTQLPRTAQDATLPLRMPHTSSPLALSLIGFSSDWASLRLHHPLMIYEM